MKFDDRIVDQHGRPLFRADGYYNDATGYGGADDSIKNTSFLPEVPMSQTELTALYKTWLIRRGVDIPIDDRLGDGIEFLTNDDDSEGRKKQLEELETIFDDLGLIDHLMQGEKWESVYGGGLLYFEYGDDPKFELRDSQRGIPFKVWAVDRWSAIPTSYYQDFIHGLDHPKIGEPETYNVVLFTTGYSRMPIVHESRIIRLGGLPLPPRELAANLMWGQPIVELVSEICKYFQISLKAMADTFQDFNWKTLEIENLPDLIASNEEADYESIIRQAAMAAGMWHNQAIGLHSSGFKLEKHTTTVTGLTDMGELMSNFVAASFGIPDSRFFSAKGGALAGSSTQSDERHYHKRLRRERKRIDTPRIQQMLWLLGYDPKDYPFRFPPLEEPTEKEKLEADDLQADIDAKYIGAQVVAPEEIAVSRFSKPEPVRRQYIIDFDARKEMTDDEDTNPDEEEKNPPKNDPESKEDRADMAEEELEVEDVWELVVIEEDE